MYRKSLPLLFILLISVVVPIANKSVSANTLLGSVSISKMFDLGSDKLSSRAKHGVYFETSNIEPQYTAPYGIKILFDSYHQGYWSSDKFTYFIQDIEDYFGVDVVIGDSAFDQLTLSDYDIIIIPEFDTNLTDAEITALKQYLESNGTILFMGDRWPYFNYPETLNATTLDYGVGWYNGNITDETDYDYRSYYPIVHVWGNNTVAKFLSNGKTYQVKFRGSPLMVYGSNTTNYTIYVIGIGDSDTNGTVLYGNGVKYILDGDVVYFLAVDLAHGGRFFASGSTEMFRTDNYYQYLNENYDNKEFAMRIIHWLLAEGLEISNVEYPMVTLKAGETAYVTMTIVNNANVAATNVKVSIEYTGTLMVLNASQEASIGTLNPGDSKKIVWEIKATGTSQAKIILKVWSDNVKGFSRAFTLNTLGLNLYLEPYPQYLLVYGSIFLDITIENPEGSGITATNINVTITLPKNLTTINDTSYHISQIAEGENITLSIILDANGSGVPLEILVDVVSENFGSVSSKADVYVFESPIILFYETHVGYFYSWRFEKLLDNASYFRPVFVYDKELRDDILSITDLIIMPDVDEPVTPDEIDLLVDYIKIGGYLLIMGNWYNYFDPEYINNITAPFGVTWYDAEILDDDDNLGRNYQIVLYNFADNPYAAYLTRGVDRIIFHGATSFNFTPVEGVEFYPIVLGNDDPDSPSYLVNATGDPMGINGSDIVAFALVKVIGGGWIALSGSTYTFRSDGYYAEYFENNSVFIWNLLEFFFETPSISITSPKSGEWYTTSTITVEWAVENDLAGVFNIFLIYLDDSYVGDVEYPSMSYELTNVGDGEHTVTVIAVNSLHIASASVTFKVDTKKPKIDAFNIANNTNYTGPPGDVSLNLTISDNMGLDKVDIVLNGSVIYTEDLNGEKTKQITATMTLNEVGVYFLEVKIKDLAGNLAVYKYVINVKQKPAGIPPMYLAVIAIVIIVGIVAAVYYFRRR